MISDLMVETVALLALNQSICGRYWHRTTHNIQPLLLYSTVNWTVNETNKVRKKTQN